MATNTADSSTEHTGNGSTTSFSISFTYLSTAEIDVKVNNVVKSIGSDYTISGQTLTFSSAPSNGHVISIKRDTNIGQKKVDFEDGSVLTETDLDNNTNQLLFGIQEIADDYVKRDGSQTITGDIVFEGSVDDANETTLSVTNPTADRTITVPDVTGTIVTTGDTGTVSSQMIATDAISNAKLAEDSVDSENYVDLSIDTQHIANENVTTAKLAPDAITGSKLADNSVDSEHYVDGSIDHVHLANDIIDGDNIQDDVINSEHYVAGSIDHEHLANDIIDGDNIQDDVINSEHYVAGSIDHEHLSNDCVDEDNIQANAVRNEHIAANAVRVNEIKDGEITSAKLNPSAVITASEQASATTNDTSFLTSAAADARFFNISTGDTIKDGQTFPDNDTTIATTAAINDRIIDLIDDVGGFTIIASEQAFPNVNPQGVTGQAAVLSIKAATTNLVPSGTTVTVVNGNVADNANITITGVPTTIPSGFGFLVESTTTLHTYAFHRLVPKATEVTTVAGKAVEIGRLGTADAVADMAILGTADVVADMNTLATADIVSDMNTLAVADVISDMNTLAVADVISDMDVVAANVTNVNNVGNNITNVNNLTNSTGANQTFTVTVQNVSGNKYFIDGVQTPVLKLARGKTYTFDMSDSSNSGHPLAFRDSSDNSYTTGVTTSGTAGSSGATVVIVVAANAPSSLKYYCTSHGNAMGNTINVIDDNVGIVAGSITNVNNVGGSIANVNSVGNDISNVNTVASNINNVNSFFNTYRIGANNPTDSLDVGDLFFNTTSDSLKVYTGSAWVDGVTATGNFALKTGNTFTGSNVHNDNVKSIYGTSSDGLEIYHNGNDSIIDDVGSGALRLQRAGVTKLSLTSGGIDVVGNITVSGNVDGRDVAADGTKLDGIESSAKDDQTAAEIKTLLDSNGIVNSNVDASAAIAGSKISPTFTSSISTTGNITANGDLFVSSAYPRIHLTDTNNNSDYLFVNDNGNFRIFDVTNNTSRFTVESSGLTKVHGNLDALAGVDVTGNITVSGTVDGRDLATDGSKLDGIASGATNNGSGNLSNYLPLSGGTLTGALTGRKLTLTDDGSSSPILDIKTDDNSPWGLRLGNDSYSSSVSSGFMAYQNNNGNLYFNLYGNSAYENWYFQTSNGSTTNTAIHIDTNRAVSLTYQGNQKLITTSSGITVTGSVSADGLALGDNEQVSLGNGSDFQVYHSGSNNFVDSVANHPLIVRAGTGDLYLQGSDIFIGNEGGTKKYIDCHEDGNVELYQSNSLKIRTGVSGDYGSVQAQNGSNGWNGYSCGGNYVFMADNTQTGIYNDIRNHWMVYCVDQGKVELRYNGSPKLETTSSGVSVTGSVTATSFSGDGSNLTGVSAGKVLQVVKGTLDGTFSTGSSSFQATGCSVTITTTGSNKVLIMAGGTVNQGSSGDGAFTTIYRGSTNISDHGTIMAGYWQEENSNNVEQSQFLHTVDSPSAGTHTYQVYIYAHNGNGTAYWGYRNTGVITAMEIES